MQGLWFGYRGEQNILLQQYISRRAGTQIAPHVGAALPSAACVCYNAAQNDSTKAPSRMLFNKALGDSEPWWQNQTPKRGLR
jgi:hypothetical protein